MLAAGLDGIEKDYEFPPDVTADVHDMTAEERAQRNIAQLPGDLHEAIEELEKSELIRETLGDQVFEWFIRNKRRDWQTYRSKITQWELDEYLPIL